MLEISDKMEKRQSSLDKYFVRKDCSKKRRTEVEEDDEEVGIGSCEDALENPDWLRIKENNLNVSQRNISLSPHQENNRYVYVLVVLRNST